LIAQSSIHISIENLIPLICKCIGDTYWLYLFGCTHILCIYIECIYIDAHILSENTHIHTLVQTHTHIYTHTHIGWNTHTHTYPNIHTHTQNIHTLHKHTHTYTYTHTHTHIHIECTFTTRRKMIWFILHYSKAFCCGKCFMLQEKNISTYVHFMQIFPACRNFYNIYIRSSWSMFVIQTLMHS